MKKTYNFPKAMNLHCKVLDDKVLKWAWEANLFDNPAELERCRVQKINWFTGFLFPEENKERLEQIMKFFLGLFLLDDLLDIVHNTEMIDFLEALKNGDSFHSDFRIHCLGNELNQLYRNFEKQQRDSFLLEQWQTEWHKYLEALQWETRIKMQRVKPNLEEYRLMRPKSSGVYLAMILIKKGKDRRGCVSDLLEISLARYIYLSNDLASYQKEKAIGDPHNEIILLMDSVGDDALSVVQRELKILREEFIPLTELIGINFNSCKKWIYRLLLLAGGCEAWTAETLRYQKNINGNSATH
ncbi:hypothetical protein FHS59_004518 [Algoriphagus iocasae]|uniref:Terpene synthase n=1 Tax=Algoriphagus iocasae TaxID=1836499 RepID=A0A841MSZ9_9BACT|nr:terpene synthase family protein [Algoriphagus iocasae]MBB6328859.1 hypothetical protein [Algoriphagus iocasae]